MFPQIAGFFQVLRHMILYLGITKEHRKKQSQQIKTNNDLLTKKKGEKWKTAQDPNTWDIQRKQSSFIIVGKVMRIIAQINWQVIFCWGHSSFNYKLIWQSQVARIMFLIFDLTLIAAAVEEEMIWRQGWDQFHIHGRARSPGSCHFRRRRSSLACWTPPRAPSHMTCQNKTEPPAPWRTSCSETGSLCDLQGLPWVGRRNSELHGTVYTQATFLECEEHCNKMLAIECTGSTFWNANLDLNTKHKIYQAVCHSRQSVS